MSAVVKAAGPASLRARIIHFIASLLLARMLIRALTTAGYEVTSARIERIGRRVNRIARLQRLQPFRRFRLVSSTWNGLPIETVSLRNLPASTDNGVILYFHGGGFVLGDLNTHIHGVATLARVTRLPVVHIEYRQYPEVDLQTTVADCLGAYRTLLSEGVDPAKVIIAGDSAGGFLAFATAQRAPQHGLPVPAGVVGISPLLELDNTARRAHQNAQTDVFGIATALPVLAERICPTADLVAQLEPVSGPMDSMPPSLIIASESEALLCDAERMQDRLHQAGRSCEVMTWPSQLHAFPAIIPRLPESRQAYARMASFIAECLAGTATDVPPAKSA
ncbi:MULTISPECIES: alpha/beta hydrolase fold domain-containing protein [unclassified Mycolicibacterium]|uniref:alpha/beta hydrolase n=2 Tax=Mycolicibacterium TaxID=1866885 RepID=UPI0028159434|nr:MULTISPECIES: alpha/beta hydrolase fold domain-containing protein [unclassified Mycolicibacterium]